MKPLWRKHIAVRAFNSDVADAIDDLVSSMSVPPFETSSILFPTKQAPSTNAYTLDDYREGTWTPSLGGSTTYTVQSGTYTKVGRLVHLHGHVNVAAIGTGSTGVIAGAPFVASALTAGSVGFFAAAVAAATSVACYIVGSSIVITSLTAAGTAMTNPATFFGAGTDVYFTVVYAATA